MPIIRLARLSSRCLESLHHFDWPHLGKRLDPPDPTGNRSPLQCGVPLLENDHLDVNTYDGGGPDLADSGMASGVMDFRVEALFPARPLR
jgi:hypothetical protein